MVSKFGATKARYENRSRVTVRVKDRDQIFRTFPYNQSVRTRARLELLEEGFKPTLVPLEGTIFVRYRTDTADIAPYLGHARFWKYCAD